MKLSKTNFLMYRDCPHNAWVKAHRPDIYNAEPLSAFDQAIIDSGNEVDELARDLFPGGVLFARGEAAETAQHIAARTPILYQPVFETEAFTTACDILVWNSEQRVYDLYEVKSSTSSDTSKTRMELYAYDMAFQAVVLRQNGVPLGRFQLVRLNSDYRRDGALDTSALFSREDLTGSVGTLVETILPDMTAAHDLLAQMTPPLGPCPCMLKGRSTQCTTFAFTNPGVPAYSVHDIARIGASPKKLAELVRRNVLAIEAVPDDFELTANQRNQIRAAKLKRPLIQLGAIAQFLDTLAYPISFLDYETFPAAIPRFSGYGAYAHIPFQFSLDVIERPGAGVVHHEFLHASAELPDSAFIAALRRALPSSGSIVVWNQSFELGINEKLAERNAEAREYLLNLEPRVADLEDVFTMQAYVDPGFRGRTSIKMILPVLVPSLSYKSLTIQEGATASTRWNDMVSGHMSADESEKTKKELLAYCGLDTLAMVEIWRALAATTERNRATG